MTAAQRERAALVKTMREVGPDAPTLCAGWTTRDLAAHLVVRERRPDAAPGIMVPALAGYTERVQRRAAAGTDWPDLLDKIASGPPLLSPFKLIDSVANMDEMFVHHEDVRRAQSDWAPRPLDDDTSAALRRPLGFMRTPDGATVATVGRGPDLIVTGDIGELTMFVAGRAEAKLTFSDAQALAAVRAARRGL